MLVGENLTAIQIEFFLNFNKNYTDPFLKLSILDDSFTFCKKFLILNYEKPENAEFADIVEILKIARINFNEIKLKKLMDLR